MQLPITVCIYTPELIANTPLFRKPDTAQFPDMASITEKYLADMQTHPALHHSLFHLRILSNACFSYLSNGLCSWNFISNPQSMQLICWSLWLGVLDTCVHSKGQTLDLTNGLDYCTGILVLIKIFHSLVLLYWKPIPYFVFSPPTKKMLCFKLKCECWLMPKEIKFFRAGYWLHVHTYQFITSTLTVTS